MITDQTLSHFNALLARRGWPPFGGAFDIFAPIPKSVPSDSGVYVLLTWHGNVPSYLNGESRIVYIGKSASTSGVRGRLASHRKDARHCAKQRSHVGDPRSEWLAARGGIAMYALAPPGRRHLYGVDTACDIEDDLLDEFVSLHWQAPHGNRQTKISWIPRKGA